VLTVAGAIAATACGGSATVAPTAPTTLGSSPGGSLSGGATITGRVAGTTGSSSRLSAGALTVDGGRLAATTTDPVTVTVVGTSASTTTNPDGTFTLTGVPSGSVQLRFAGRGGTATVTISGIQEADRIEIVVSLTGDAAEVESENRQKDNNRVEVNGRIAAVDAAAGTFTVGTTVVTVPPGTTIRHGSRTFTLANLSVGDKVQVKGTRTIAGLTATEVMVQSAGNPTSTIGPQPPAAGAGSGRGASNGRGGGPPSGRGGPRAGDDDDSEDEEEDDDDEDEDEDDEE
jgi:hypothetical protein